MKCDHCNSEVELTFTVNVVTGKRGRPPKKNVCDTCSKLPLFKLPGEKVERVSPEQPQRKVTRTRNRTTKAEAASEFEKRLLDHPPTPEGWICTNQIQREAGLSECGIYNGKHERCISCNAPRPDFPKLAWPIYLEARARLIGV